MAERMDEVVAALREEIGASLRGVFYGDFKTREYTVAYANESVITQYSPEETEEIVDDIALEQVGKVRQEALFEPIGALQYTVRYFEDGINVMAWGFEDVPTVYVGLDGDEGNVPLVIDRLRTLSETEN